MLNKYGNLFFPGKTIKTMADKGLSDRDIWDVYGSGTYQKSPDGGTFVVKKYNGYEIGFFYVLRGNGEFTVTGVWKKGRR